MKSMQNWKTAEGRDLSRTFRSSAQKIRVHFITISAIMLISFIGDQELNNALFNAISAIACGGFAIGDLAAMHRFSIYILILLMISGGMVGSTTGGIKLRRVIIVLKAIWLQIKAAFLPFGSVQVVKLNNIAVALGQPGLTKRTNKHSLNALTEFLGRNA